MTKMHPYFFIHTWFVLYCQGVLGDQDAVKSVSVMEGESVTLDPELTEIQSDKEIEWRFGEIRIARLLMNNAKYYDERFKDRLKLDQTGSLTITNTRTTDSGLYKLSTIIQNKDSVRRFNVAVDGNKSISTITSQNPSSSESIFPELHQQTPSVSLIVLISAAAAAGSLLILAAVGIICICICKKSRKTDQQVQTRDEEITYADSTSYKQYTHKAEDEVVYTHVIMRCQSNYPA